MSPQQNVGLSLTKRLLLLIILGAASVFLIKGIYALGPTQSESQEERKIKTSDFKDMPVILVKVRNLQSETWYEDLEIELKNVSDKPIYFFTANLRFPDDRVGGSVYGIILSWGDTEKLDDLYYSEPEAEHVEPGKTFVVTIPEQYIKGLRAMHRMRPQVSKNLFLRFEKTYFGDGTGLEVEGDRRDFRSKRPPPQREQRHHSKRWPHIRERTTQLG